MAAAFVAAVATALWLVDLLAGRQSVTVGVAILGLVAYASVGGLIYWFATRQLASMELLALTDSLCGLPNRRALHNDVKLGSELGAEVAIALIDLDGFKTINDFYGRSAGDQTIRKFADLLSDFCADNGRAYRLGGDEFALVMSGPQAGNIIEGLCRRLLARLEEPLKVGDRSIALGASIGLARGVQAAERVPTSTDLLRKADVAMCAAKSRGKMRVTWFKDEFDKHREMHQLIDADLRKALIDGELRMHYQPLIDTTTGRVGSVEALIRWERPDGQRIGPDKFIPVAEESGLIEAIGLWVLRQSCSDALQWNDITLSVNVSVAQLRNPQFPLQLGQILEETGFPAARLELEITETFLIGDPTVAKRNLEMIREFGVGIVLDDYGTGYASIGFLRRFRFEKLKLDRSLIVDAASDLASRTIMNSSVAMAKALGMKVTAEGIETEQQAAMARTAGCDQMQGWLYSRAIPADEIAQHLDRSDSIEAANVLPIRASRS